MRGVQARHAGARRRRERRDGRAAGDRTRLRAQPYRNGGSRHRARAPSSAREARRPRNGHPARYAWCVVSWYSRFQRCIADMCALPSTVLAAEESGAGKQILLDRGAYKDMDVCMMYVTGRLPPPPLLSLSCVRGDLD